MHRESRFLALAILALACALTTARASAAVTIQSFTAQAQTTSILVKWATASELINSGFNLYRSTSPSGSFTKINSSLIPANSPGGIIGSNYTFTDSGVAKGQIFYYKLESVEFGGATQLFGPVNAVIPTPTFTPTTATPTATPTPMTLAPSPTYTPIPGTPTPTTYASPTPPGTPPPTDTPFQTRVAIFVAPSTPLPSTAAPQRARSNNTAPPAPPQPDSPLSVPTLVGVAENPESRDSAPTVDSSTDETLANSTPLRSTERNPLLIAFTLLAGFFAVASIAVGAVSFYFIARKYIR